MQKLERQFDILWSQRTPLSHAQGGFSTYAAEVSRKHCPFIKPAEAQDTIFVTRYHLNTQTRESAEQEAFYRLVVHTELLRHLRKISSSKTRHLFCENVSFILPKALLPETSKRFFGWPHWTLKVLYTKVELAFGDFWLGETESDKRNEPIPSPPEFFISIRSSVKRVDKQFFMQHPPLLEQYQSSVDDDRNIADEFGIDKEDLRWLNRMGSANFYHLAKQKAALLLSEIKNTY